MNRVTIREAQEADEVLQEVRKWVKGKPPESREELRGMPDEAHVYHKLLGVQAMGHGEVLVRNRPAGVIKSLFQVAMKN